MPIRGSVHGIYGFKESILGGTQEKLGFGDLR
jgi:hypothetical protein